MPWFGHTCLYNLNRMLLGILFHLCCFKKKNLSPLVWLGRAALTAICGELILDCSQGFVYCFPGPLCCCDAVSETYVCVHLCNKLRCCSLCLKPPIVFRENQAWGRFKRSRTFSIFGPLALLQGRFSGVTCLQQGELPLGFLSCSFPSKTFPGFH